MDAFTIVYLYTTIPTILFMIYALFISFVDELSKIGEHRQSIKPNSPVKVPVYKLSNRAA